MNMHIEVRGLSPFTGDNGKYPFRTLALAEIFIPNIGMSIKNVRLVWSEKKGYEALSPMPWRGVPSGVVWYHDTAFGIKMTAALIDMYVRMGYELPAPRPHFRFDHVTGKPIGPDPLDKPSRLAEEFQYRGVDPAVGAAARARRQAESRGEAAGLLRTLKACPAVAETLDRAEL